ncbi:putative membrane protein [Yarrowia sp. C11]|nr:putative membrane protein [Yarrowia sp. C11]KAG5370532.1 putative membrane protein [Yarrowia sp. E02]
MSFIAKHYGKKYVSSHVNGAIKTNLEPAHPYHYYEEIPLPPGANEKVKPKKKKIKRVLPQGLVKKDEKILKSFLSTAYQLDWIFDMCGFGVGWGTLIGLIPVVGDLFIFYLGYRLIKKAKTQLSEGLPAGLEAQMVLNLAVGCGLGFIPLVGDVINAVFKCSTRNANLLETHLRQQVGVQAVHAAPALPARDPLSNSTAVGSSHKK